jgi:Translation initiation factor IF-2, N-terminal region
MEARVHEVAKELRKTSKAIMAALTDMGEFVKSPSSTVDATAVRKLREKFGTNHAASYSAAPPPSPQAAADSLFLAPLAKPDLRGEAAEMFGVSPDTLKLRDAPGRLGPRPGTRSAARPAVPVTKIQGTKLAFASPRRGRPVSAAEAPNHDAEWARHFFTPEQRALWMDGGLRDSQADMAAQCAEFEIDPSMLSLKLSGTTVIQRLQSGESPQQIWARIREDAEAPRTGTLTDRFRIS